MTTNPIPGHPVGSCGGVFNAAGCGCRSGAGRSGEASVVTLTVADPEPRATFVSDAVTALPWMRDETARVVRGVLDEDPEIGDRGVVDSVVSYWKGRIGKATHESLRFGSWSAEKVPAGQRKQLSSQFRTRLSAEDGDTATHLRWLAAND